MLQSVCYQVAKALRKRRHLGSDAWPKDGSLKTEGQKVDAEGWKIIFFICLLLLRDVYWNAVFAYSIINCEVSTVIFPELLNILSLLAYLEVSRIDVAVKYGTEFVRLMQQETRCSQIM